MNEQAYKALELHKQGLCNKEIAQKLRCSHSQITVLLKTFGIQKQNTRRFSDFEAQFVKTNYQQMGDKELAQRLTDMGYPRNLKMVEKFRSYKNLKRTKEQLKDIRKKHQSNGVWQDLSHLRTPEIRQKRSETMRKIWKREKWRMDLGMSPITGLANRKMTKRRLSTKQVLEIRDLRLGKLKAYAKKCGVSISLVSLVRKRRLYIDIPEKEPVIRVPMKGGQIQYSTNQLNI